MRLAIEGDRRLTVRESTTIETYLAACISFTILLFTFDAIRLKNSLQVVEERYEVFPLPRFPHCALYFYRNG